MWRHGVAWPRTVGQQVLAGVVPSPWKLGHETQVSTPRMYVTKQFPYLRALYREQDYQVGQLCGNAFVGQSTQCTCWPCSLPSSPSLRPFSPPQPIFPRFPSSVAHSLAPPPPPHPPLPLPLPFCYSLLLHDSHTEIITWNLVVQYSSLSL